MTAKTLLIAFMFGLLSAFAGLASANYKLGLQVNEPAAPMMDQRWTLDGCETVCRPVAPRDMGRK